MDILVEKIHTKDTDRTTSYDYGWICCAKYDWIRYEWYQ